MFSLLVALSFMGGSDHVSDAPWFFPPDYPAALLSQQSEGTVEFRLTFDAGGRVSACDIQKSSGVSLLDATACRLSVRRARAKKGEARVQSFRHIWKAPRA